MKGKSTFTKQEADAIIELIKQKLKASSEKQKGIRNKIRKLRFYASDFGLTGGYTVNDFLSVVKIIGHNYTVEPSNGNKKNNNQLQTSTKKKRSTSDEAYIIDLCDEVLGLKAVRQKRFDFLKGDSGTTLPVDAFYPSLNLVIEYREKQHTEAVKLFDRRMTVSGVSRGEQRKKYDQYRRDQLPKNGITLIEFGYEEFEHDSRKQLKRIRRTDLEIVKAKLKKIV